MLYFFIIFLCNGLLYLFLLEDRFRITTTLLSSAVIYILSMVLLQPVSYLSGGSDYYIMFCILTNCGLLFISSLYLFKNSLAHKIYLAVLCFSNYYFITFLCEALLGAFTFQTAGLFANVFAAMICLLFYLLIGLCLYRVLHYFSDRASSGFMAVTICLQLIPVLMVSGLFDFFFHPYLLAGKLVSSVLAYMIIIFSFRSLYHAAKFREEASREKGRKQLLQSQADRFVEMYALANEYQRIYREQEYILDAVTLMVKDNVAEQIPAFIASQRNFQTESILMKSYHENPYLNAILVSHAAFAKENKITFECNVQTLGKRFPVSDLCIITNDILTKACQEAKAFAPDARIRYLVSPGEETLRIEAVFSANTQLTPERIALEFDPEPLTLSKLFQIIFREKQKKSDRLGLDQTKEVVSRYSGKMDVSNTEDSTMIHISLYE